MKHLIYVLIDPNTNEIRYVGKTSNLARRLTTHYSPSNLKPNTHKNNWLKKLLTNNQKAIVSIVQECETKEELDQLEKMWIVNYKILGCNLVNGTDGGEGGKTSNRTGANNPMYGRKHSKETKLKMSNKSVGNTRWLGKKHTEETKKKMSDSRKLVIKRNYNE